jgi:hypothetical protein
MEKYNMKNQTIGELVAKHTGSEQLESKAATHFYHPWMKKIYSIDLKPHFEQVFARWGALRRRLSKLAQII